MRIPPTLFALLATGSIACSSDPSRDDLAEGSQSITSVGAYGGLNMYRYVPSAMPKNAPLVLALHGCTQKAADFDNVGWSALAESQKFYMVYAEQTTTNNPVSCFDWWGAYNAPSDKTNITRGKGEPAAIMQMIAKMKSDYSIDPSRVFVVGFSAGAGEAAVMLALYPDVFAAGAIMSGIPFDCPASSNSDVFNCMSPGKSLSADDWGNRARAGFPGYKGPWPRVSIWHGTKDTTVAPLNEGELVKQWTNVHGIAATGTTETVDGQVRHRFGTQVESWEIAGMAHGVAVDPSHGCGKAGAYVLDQKICSTTHVAEFFGLSSPASPPVDAGAPPDAAPAVDAAPPPPPPPSGAIVESVSSGGLDLAGWSLGGWDLATVDHTGKSGSQSLHAKIASALGKTARIASLPVHATSHLSYARRLSLRGANIGATVRFAIEIVDGGVTSIVDEKTIKLGSYAETDWTLRGDLDLSAHAGHDVTLRLVLSVDDGWSYTSSAEAWLDDVDLH